MTASRWTDEDINRAAAFWKDGLSAGEIARQMNRTRNAVCGIVDRNREIFAPRTQKSSGKSRKERLAAMRDRPADAGLKKRIVNQLSRDARNRERAIEKAQALRNGQVPADAVTADDFDIASIFAVDPSSGMKGDFSRMRLSGVESVAFVDLKSGQCKLPLVGFHEIAGPFSPCCGADTGDVLKPWCWAHRPMMRAA